ncbi:SAP domain-containing protein [Ligilactobacillus sp. LYQ139]|uniref:SAP domain-containing protein n=1 Tax=Ligilactobacillus sp. LYQ139 TaxID=3378800 RepID=UPI00385545DD
MIKITKENLKKEYWYKKDLQRFCSEKGLPSYGTKAELLIYIEKYFGGTPLSDIKPLRRPKRASKKLLWDEMTPETKILNSGFSLNGEARKFFKYYLGLEKFSFKKNMAIKLREIERNQDEAATIQDLINAYFNSSKIRTPEEKTYEWNHFVKDFFNDENSKKFGSKLKVASILWSNVKQSAGSKKYNSSLIEKYKDKIQDYML